VAAPTRDDPTQPQLRGVLGVALPGQERLAHRVIPGRQPGVGDDDAGEAVGVLRHPAQPNQPAPVLPDERHTVQADPVEQGLAHPVHVPGVGVVLAAGRFVRAAETDQVRGDHPQPGRHQRRDHRAVEERQDGSPCISSTVSPPQVAEPIVGGCEARAHGLHGRRDRVGSDRTSLCLRTPRGRRRAVGPGGESAGAPVLLLHGNPTWSYLWRDTIEPLVQAGYRVLVPDWGGPIGLAFAASHPQAVRALVLMSTWAWPDPSPFHSTVVPRRMLHAPLVGPHLLCRHNSLADRGVYLSVVDRAGFRDRAGRAYADAMPDPASRLPTVLFPRLIPLDGGSWTHDFFGWLEEQLPSLQMPALVLWGRQDDVFPPSYADRFVQALPDAQGPVLVTGRHFLQEDSGREIGEHIAGFLAEVEVEQP
jgi:pimeloyl-ACP methyl ester carboxylesterase